MALDRKSQTERQQQLVKSHKNTQKCYGEATFSLESTDDSWEIQIQDKNDRFYTIYTAGTLLIL